MSEIKNKAWLIKQLNELRKSCSDSAVPPDKGYYTAKVQAYKKAVELAGYLEVDSTTHCRTCQYAAEISCDVCACTNPDGLHTVGSPDRFCSAGREKICKKN